LIDFFLLPFDGRYAAPFSKRAPFLVGVLFFFPNSIAWFQGCLDEIAVFFFSSFLRFPPRKSKSISPVSYLPSLFNSEPPRRKRRLPDGKCPFSFDIRPLSLFFFFFNTRLLFRRSRKLSFPYGVSRTSSPQARFLHFRKKNFWLRFLFRKYRNAFLFFPPNHLPQFPRFFFGFSTSRSPRQGTQENGFSGSSACMNPLSFSPWQPRLAAPFFFFLELARARSRRRLSLRLTGAHVLFSSSQLANPSLPSFFFPGRSLIILFRTQKQTLRFQSQGGLPNFSFSSFPSLASLCRWEITANPFLSDTRADAVGPLPKLIDLSFFFPDETSDPCAFFFFYGLFFFFATTSRGTFLRSGIPSPPFLPQAVLSFAFQQW